MFWMFENLGSLRYKDENVDKAHEASGQKLLSYLM